jgi:hypothetical protein
MRKLNKLAAAIAVALSTGIASQAHAVISTHFDQEGDAMLFPVFYGAIENYYTVFNNSNTWTQVHVRFRGAAWSAELLDFPVILSPGDQFVMRVADLDGDGNWEIDQSIDPSNYGYTPLPTECYSDRPETTDGGTEGAVSECMDFSAQLIPVLTDLERADDVYPNLEALDDAYGVIGQRPLETRVSDPRTAYGYVEVIGEAVLEECSNTRNADQYCDWDQNGKSNFPLTARMWDEQNPRETPVADFTPGNDLSGVGNWLSGRFYLAVDGTSGFSGNALMFRDFRTAMNPHRLDNYIRDPEVILVDGPASAEDGNYIYRFNDTIPIVPAPSTFERGVSFNNTWGPTLADGDDYALGAGAMMNFTVTDAVVGRTTATTTAVNEIQLGGDNILDLAAFRAGTAVGADFWDDAYGPNELNSIAEVELALDSNMQSFTSQFFDNRGIGSSAAERSMYVAHFPTKFFRGEGQLDLNPGIGFDQYVKLASNYLLSDEVDKAYNVEVWDIDENSSCGTIVDSTTSPATVIQRECAIYMPHELQLLDISQLKAVQDVAALGYDQGQVVLSPVSSDLTTASAATFLSSYPGVLYTFNYSFTNTLELDHWVPMIRSENLIAR